MISASSGEQHTLQTINVDNDNLSIDGTSGQESGSILGDSSSSGNTDSASNTTGDTTNRRAVKALGISEAGDQAVNVSRSIFVLCLLTSAVIFATVVHFLATVEEQNNLEIQVRYA